MSFQHSIPKANIDLYAGFNHTAVDDVAAGTSVKDIDVFTAGSRIKFD